MCSILDRVTSKNIVLVYAAPQVNRQNKGVRAKTYIDGSRDNVWD